jgi:methylated-DNA-[protein]-cysteine S-methyltransferase
MQAPIDAVGIAVDDTGVCAVRFGGAAGPLVSGDPMLARAVEELTGYFAGDSAPFTVPLSVSGGSQFERSVWRALWAIPYAEMRTYGQIAAAVGEPDGARAVGVACNRNPLPIIVPCHRVVGADGSLTGYGGGLERKQQLLDFERGAALF